MDVQVLTKQKEPTSNRSVLTQDVAWKAFWERWMKEVNGEKELGKSVLAVWLDNDDVWGEGHPGPGGPRKTKWKEKHHMLVMRLIFIQPPNSSDLAQGHFIVGATHESKLMPERKKKCLIPSELPILRRLKRQVMNSAWPSS